MSQEINGEEVVAEGLDEEDSWMNCMKQKILVVVSDAPFHEEHLIYRVHSPLCEENPSSYEPTATSISPYHWGKEHLLDMETHKRGYVSHLLSRNENIRFEDLVKMMKDREQRVRACYPGKIELESNAFIEMMLLDGCFIVEFLLKTTHKDYNGDLFVGPDWRLEILWERDLVLLENQHPFFFLQEIFNAVMPDKTDPQAFVKLSLEFLKRIELNCTLNEEVLPMASKSVHHLLHLWHKLIIPFRAKQHQELKIGMCNCCKGTTLEERLLSMPGVTQLEMGGIKFKASRNNLLEIEFYNRELIIPTVYMSDHIETQLRNLLAVEQCCLKQSHYYLSCYVDFLDSIINTSEDVKILRKKYILTDGWGDNEEVVLLFSKLTKGLIVPSTTNYYLTDTFRRVNDYSRRRINKWRATLVRNYFYSPWAVLSIMTAIIALSLTAISAVYSVKSFINDLHQHKK